MKVIVKTFLFLIGAVLVCGLLNAAVLLSTQKSDFLVSAKSKLTELSKAASTFASFGPKGYSVGIFLKDCKKLSDHVINSRLLINLWNITLTYHNDIEQQFQDSLEKLFGSEAFFLPSNVSSANPNLLSGILLVLWLILGWSSISKMSYSKFFTLMSSLFLLNAVFGPRWSFRRFLFLCAFISWIMLKAAKFPMEAAGLILVVFGLSLIAKWKDKIKGKKNSEEAVENTKHLMEMMQRLDQKIDDCLAKIDILTKGIEK